MMSTVDISFENLLVCGWDDDSDDASSVRLPMSRLGLDENACVHGTIRLLIGGRLVPHMGGLPDDVCLAEWLGNLGDVEDAFRAGQNARVVVGGAEQGEPAFVWEREGEQGHLTIADSEMSSGGVADAQWQKIPFLVGDFFAAHAHFRAEAREFIVHEAPHCGLDWWDDWGGGRFEGDAQQSV